MTIKEAVQYTCERLSEKGCTLHRYDSVPTKSVYLKVDGGLAYSVRFSDHRGYQHLKYHYNYMAQEPGESRYSILDDGKARFFYEAGALDDMIDDILEAREHNRKAYRDYPGAVKAEVRKNLDLVKGATGKKRGFWGKAKEVKCA